MLWRHRQVLSTAVFVLDGTLVGLSWLGAYWLRFVALGIPAPLGVPPLELHLWFGAVLTPVSLLVLRSFHLYRSARTARLSQELVTLIQGVAIVTAIAGLGSFLGRGELSRGMLAMFAALAGTSLCLSRVVIRGTLRALRRRGYNLRRVLVVGTGELAQRVLAKIRAHRDYGLTVQGVIASDPARVGSTLDGVPVIGAVADLSRRIEETHAEVVYVALPRSEHEAEREALERLSDSTASVRLVPDLAWAFTLNAGVEDFDGLPIVRVTDTPGQGWNAVIKRGFDLVCSTLGLVVLSPVLLLIALWVRLDSPGPVLYAQERMGMNGRRFRMLKFRTMHADAESQGPGWTTAGDSRRTRAGVVLRRTSLDELPQLWNVLLGHMSLVGPRPERPLYVEEFRARIPRYMLRHHVKAGLTGWAQVNGLRGDTPLDQRITYDLYYIRHWSLAFDMRILLMTFSRVFRDANAH